MRRLCLVSLFVALLVVGCTKKTKEKTDPRQVTTGPTTKTSEPDKKTGGTREGGTKAGNANKEKDRERALKGLMEQAKKARSANRKDDAAKLYRQALELDPDNKEAQRLLIQVDPTEENYQLAMSAGQDALKKGNYRGAVNSYNAALQVRKDDRKALAQRKRARKLLDDAYQKWVKQGNSALAGKKFKEARTAFDEALKLKADDEAATKGKVAAEAGLKPDPKEAPTRRRLRAVRRR